LPVDHKNRRERGNFPKRLQIDYRLQKERGSWRWERYRIVDFGMLFKKRFRLSPSLVINIKPDDFEGGFGIFIAQRCNARNAVNTSSAPRGPDINNHSCAAEIRNRFFSTAFGCKCKRAHRKAARQSSVDALPLARSNQRLHFDVVVTRQSDS